MYKECNIYIYIYIYMYVYIYICLKETYLHKSNLFWKHVRSCRKVKIIVGIIKRDDGSTTETHYEAAK